MNIQEDIENFCKQMKEKENARWDSEKLKYGNIAYMHQEKADKLAEQMNEGISPYAWYVSKVNGKLAFNGISRKVDYTVCLEKI